MNLSERLLEAMKDAMRARDQLRLDTIRLARAAIKNAEIERRRPLGEDEVLEVLSREVKQRRDAIAEFGERAPEFRAKLEAELAVLHDFLPQAIGRDELGRIVDEVIAELGATGPRDLGKVMGALMPRIRGRADGREVNALVRERLGG